MYRRQLPPFSESLGKPFVNPSGECFGRNVHRDIIQSKTETEHTFVAMMLLHAGRSGLDGVSAGALSAFVRLNLISQSVITMQVALLSGVNKVAPGTSLSSLILCFPLS